MAVPTKTDLTLYELVTHPDGGKAFSPFVWATKLLGVSVDSKPLSFHQIRHDLAEETGNNEVTVPTLKLPSGEYITESFKIAEWLEEHHRSSTASLFPGGPAGKSFAKFIDGWVRTVFVNRISPLTAPPVMQQLDPLSLEYYKSTRFSSHAEAEDHMRSINLGSPTSPDHVQAVITDTQNRLRALEKILSYQVDAGKEPWMLGEPSHADAVVFGWYAYTRINPVGCRELWGSDNLPLVKRWVELVKGVVGDDAGLP